MASGIRLAHTSHRLHNVLQGRDECGSVAVCAVDHVIGLDRSAVGDNADAGHSRIYNFLDSIDRCLTLQPERIK